MRVYNTPENTINEWSRMLRIPRNKTVEETIKVWSKRLAERYGRSFIIKETPAATLNEWSKII